MHGLPVCGFTPPDTEGAPVPGHLDMPAKPSLSHHASQHPPSIPPCLALVDDSSHSPKAPLTDEPCLHVRMLFFVPGTVQAKGLSPAGTSSYRALPATRPGCPPLPGQSALHLGAVAPR